MANATTSARPRVLIVGAGFGGLTAARALAGAPVEVTLIDRRNYHLFQPLLYQVATAGLSPADIASPIRSILAGQQNATVLLGRTVGVDVEGKRVLLDKGSVPYDFLILATGARHAYFGHDDWEAHAPGLKKIDDATQIRRRLLLAVEEAEAEPDPQRRSELMTFVVVGGGPTGVEMAGAIAELTRRAFAGDFRRIDLTQTRILLVEAGPRVLASFPEALSEKARLGLVRLGVEVRLGEAVSRVDLDGVVIGNERIHSKTVIWAAGVEASPAAKWIQAEADRAGRIKVGGDLSVPGHKEIFAIGDTALALGLDGKPFPGVAPVAKQQGGYLARLIRARVTGRPDPGPFRYRAFGNLATIGRASAVADFGWIRLTGWIAWVLWCVAHIYFLIGFRNRLAVTLDWLWAYLTFQRGARLITGPEA